MTLLHWHLRLTDKSSAVSGFPKRLGFHKAQWLGMERTFVWRSVLLKCSLKPFLASTSIPLLCNWLSAMSLFSKLTDFNFPGNSGMVRVMCVALHVMGPRRKDRENAYEQLFMPQNDVPHNWSCPFLGPYLSHKSLVTIRWSFVQELCG